MLLRAPFWLVPPVLVIFRGHQPRLSVHLAGMLGRGLHKTQEKARAGGEGPPNKPITGRGQGPANKWKVTTSDNDPEVTTVSLTTFRRAILRSLLSTSSEHCRLHARTCGGKRLDQEPRRERGAEEARDPGGLRGRPSQRAYHERDRAGVTAARYAPALHFLDCPGVHLFFRRLVR